MPADVMAQAFYAVVAYDEPELQRPETPAQRHLPVAVIYDGARLGGLIAEVFGQDAECLDERGAVGDVEAVAVEVGEHPLMRVKAVGVSQLQAVVDVPEFGAQSRSAAHGAIHVQPEAVLAAEAAQFGERVEAIGGSGANGGRDKARLQAGFHRSRAHWSGSRWRVPARPATHRARRWTLCPGSRPRPRCWT